MSDDKQNMLEKLRLFIEGKLPQEEADRVKKQIQESKELFHSYVELKEAIFLKKEGKPASRKFEQKILNIVKAQKAPHFKYIIRYLKDKVIVTSGGQDKLDFTGVQAHFDSSATYRSEDGPGPVTISRKLTGRDVTIVLTPIEDSKEFSLSVLFKKQEKIQVDLQLNQEEVESIPDTTKQKMFSIHITEENDIDLIFKKNNEIIFTINLKLQYEV